MEICSHHLREQSLWTGVLQIILQECVEDINRDFYSKSKISNQPFLSIFGSLINANRGLNAQEADKSIHKSMARELITAIVNSR